MARTFGIVFGYSGQLLIALSCFLILPLFVDFIYGEYHQSYETTLAFVLPAAAALLLGISCYFLFAKETPNKLQATLICSVSWLVFSALGAIPYVLAINSSYLDGFFEAMSGFTTTGITMFTGLDYMPRSIIFWRALTQWIGGLGILTMFMVVVFKGGSTHRLFGAEGHKIAVSRPVPGLAHTVKILFTIYVGLTLVIAVALYALDVSLFDSICHSFATLSTGGFSPYDASIDYYRLSGHSHYISIQYVLILGMIMGGTSFAVHYRLLKGNWRALGDNLEIRYWWTLIAIFLALIFLERSVKIEPIWKLSLSSPRFWHELEESLRSVLFQVVSIITTFGTRDIGTSYFGEGARQLFLVMMVIGGCVGSTSGGIKVLRIAILNRLIRREVYRVRVPAQVVSRVVIDGELVPLDEIQRVGGLFFMWIVLLIFGGGVTEYLSHYSGYAALSGMFSALGNIGPCYIPAAEMGQLHPLIKIVYILGMLAGRLEILPVLLLFNLKAWSS
ncbi:MAG: TrkH family potassium uptake protein [Deltaproteobacteria bacterium]|nr:TrkH family potassium uptake protein [Deltaproteobacteria bacterium]